MPTVIADVAAATGPLAVDVEATGLDIFSASYRVRTVQLATKDVAWVFLVDEAPNMGMKAAIGDILASRPILLAHNASYDLLALDRFGYLDLVEAWGRMVDTRLLAHLLDPRAKSDGSVGHKLENLAKHYLGDPTADRYEVDLFAHFRANGWAKNTGEGYRKVDLYEPIYHRYGAADVVNTAWLFDILAPLVRAGGYTELSTFEHNIARVCSEQQRRGMRVDTEYATILGAWLDKRDETAAREAATLGVDNVNSTIQVSTALQALGQELHVKTDKGALQVNKDVLEGIVNFGEAAPAALAQAVMDAKNASKFRKAYVTNVINSLGVDGRCHASINSLQARTARMSVSGPPLHQIPSRDWRIRRLFVPSDGYVIGASDYKQIELRVLGALAGETAILDAVRDGIDLHQLTADRVGIPRYVAKETNFLICYGGGAKRLSMTTGQSIAQSKDNITGFKRSYPAVTRYSKRLINQSHMGKLAVETATGRKLPLDRSRIYAATNYTVQSTARDIFAQGVLDLDAAGLGEYLLLPMHDESIYEVPKEDATELCNEITKVMSMRVLGVDIDADGAIYGASWGHGYGAPEDLSQGLEYAK